MTIPVAFVHGSMISVLVFVLICVVIIVSFLAAVGHSTLTQTESVHAVSIGIVLITVYLSLIIGIVESGLLERNFIPLGPAFLMTTVLVAMAVGFTSVGKAIANRVPLACLVGFQGFRLPLECVLHDWFRSGTIPESMTWSGSNWDIVTGLLACSACAFVQKRAWLAWTVNIVGIVLLLNVARVAVMSSPVPFGWQLDPPLELILHLPYALIVPICVGGAALGHVLLTRRLAGNR
jgi:hypothetical protein